MNVTLHPNKIDLHLRSCADLEGGWGGVSGPPPPEFANLNFADISGNEKNSYFSYLCIGPSLEKFSGSAPDDGEICAKFG